MSKRGGRRLKKIEQLKVAAEDTFKPVGKGPCKRTPKTILEQQELTNETLFEPEKITAQRFVKGVLQFLVSWRGYSAKYDSWEPLVNIPGSEDLVRDYRLERVREEEKAEKKRQEAKRKRIEEEAKQVALLTTGATESDGQAVVAALTATDTNPKLGQYGRMNWYRPQNQTA